ncbi:hypothetical protein Pcac1_g21625 [Phytophthora cactorum]|nr:hypothetical protein Pcac1_g21625 [Phytophthora cactorum]
MLDDENTALLNVIPDRLAEADKKVTARVQAHRRTPRTQTTSRRKRSSVPLAFNQRTGAEDGWEAETRSVNSHQLHAINRVFCASNLVTIQHSARSGRNSWARRSRRSAARIFKTCEVVDIVPFDEELSPRPKALSMSRALLLVHGADHLHQRPLDPVPHGPAGRVDPSAPHAFSPPEHSPPAPAVGPRFVLYAAMERSAVARSLVGRSRSASEASWVYPDDSSVLKLQVVEGNVVMVAGGLATRC